VLCLQVVEARVWHPGAYIVVCQASQFAARNISLLHTSLTSWPNMKLTIILAFASVAFTQKYVGPTKVPLAAASSALHATIIPRATPTISYDPWYCATEEFDQYFNPPKPTGALHTAIDSFASSLYNACSGSNPTALLPCPNPEQSAWCGFTTVAPKSVLSDYQKYGSTASSWWFARSSEAVRFARDCPNGWYEAMRVSNNRIIVSLLTITNLVCTSDHTRWRVLSE
jgi:hypothetical protein